LAPLSIVVAGALYAIGSALPWASITAPFVGTISKSGLEGGDGVVTLLIGIVLALVGLGHLTGSRAAGSKLATVLLSVAALGMAAFEISTVSSRLADIDSDVGYASTGIGLWLMAVGGVLALLSALALAPRKANSAA
jgi:hypothetical protein